MLEHTLLKILERTLLKMLERTLLKMLERTLLEVHKYPVILTYTLGDATLTSYSYALYHLSVLPQLDYHH
jgi:hypothetical protein